MSNAAVIKIATSYVCARKFDQRFLGAGFANVMRQQFAGRLAKKVCRAGPYVLLRVELGVCWLRQTLPVWLPGILHWNRLQVSDAVK